MNSNLILCILIAIGLIVSVSNLVVSIVLYRKILSSRKTEVSEFNLTALFGKRNYHNLVKDCKGNCDTCPFTVCFDKQCLEYKERVLRNDSEISVWIKPKYKRK